MGAARHEIPVIDLEGSVASVAAAIDRAAREVGFFTITGHGIASDVLEAAWELGRQFFQLPIAVRESVAFPEPGYPYGYCALSAETLSYSLGEDSPPDLKETFAIGPVDPLPDGFSGFTDPDEAAIFAPNLWPAEPVGLRAAWEAYYREMVALAERLMRLFRIGLGVGEEYFTPFIDRHGSAMRMVHYPHVDGPAEPGQLRAGPHTDYGTLTILRQDGAPGGLEVRAVDGSWVPVPFVADSFIINIGDLMQQWTNDEWRSTLHRVVLPPAGAAGSTERFSLPFFHNANWDALIECLPSCMLPADLPRYLPIRAGAHLMSKFRSTIGAPDPSDS